MESTIIANSTDSQNHETTSAISSSIGGGDGGSPGGDGSDGGMGGIVGGDGGAGEGGDVIASSIYSAGFAPTRSTVQVYEMPTQGDRRHFHSTNVQVADLGTKGQLATRRI